MPVTSYRWQTDVEAPNASADANGNDAFPDELDPHVPGDTRGGARAGCAIGHGAIVPITWKGPPQGGQRIESIRLTRSGRHPGNVVSGIGSEWPLRRCLLG